MKKVCLMIALTVSALSYGQKLEVTPRGIRDSQDTTKTYVVITCEGKAAKELYDNAIKYVNKNYKNPDEVIKGKTEGEFLSFITFAEGIVMFKSTGIIVRFDANYRIMLNFKDNKVKYEIIELDIHLPQNTTPLYFVGSGGFEWYIYNKKGELKREDAKNQIESYFNSQILRIQESLSGKDINSDW